MSEQIESIKEFENMEQVNEFLEKELGGRVLKVVPNPKHETEIAKQNSYIKRQIKQFQDKWDEGFKAVAIKKKCPCSRTFWEPYIKFLKDDNPEYIEAKSGKLGESVCGMCYGIGNRLRDIGVGPAYTKGVMTSVWDSLHGISLKQSNNELKLEKGIDINHLLTIGYKPRVVLFEPPEGHEEAEKKYQERQEALRKQQEELNKAAAKSEQDTE